MKSPAMQRAFSSVGQMLILALFMGYLCLLAMASIPSLHHLLHGDSDEHGHHCAVTALLDGHPDRSTTLPVAVAQPTLRPETAPVLGSAPEPLAAFLSGVRGRSPPWA